ncbi:hypothetical protein [uncultured Cellulomonas sp.]|uniref:hypothetical protein n=1 Tax=uncultured Cellulomonas sp. TaxID=189682 RepID=UPI00260CD02B|nr:hypothetical protein [uncultured Cellulomonas sp.]
MGPDDAAGPRPDRPAPTRATLLWAGFDAVLTALWTAARELDDRPARRRLVRAGLLAAVVPRVIGALRAARAAMAEDRTDPDGDVTGGGQRGDATHDDATVDPATAATPAADTGAPADDHTAADQPSPDGRSRLARRTTAWAVAAALAGLGTLTVVGSHRLEAAAIGALGRRGVRRPAVALGAALGAVQLVLSLLDRPDDAGSQPQTR